MSDRVLVHQSYWDRSYAGMRPVMADANDPVRRWIEAHVAPVKDERHAIEIGCFPGRYLAVIGALGYTVHGIDLTPEVKRMQQALDEMGLRTGLFTHGDFLQHPFARTYDLVCSFGFIEHFTDWQGVLLKHAALVRPGGTLLIETPNFGGWGQRLLHAALDAENFKRHHVPAMDPRAWSWLLEGEGFAIRDARCFGRFAFWHDSPRRNALVRMGDRMLRLVGPLLRAMPEGRAFSPFCGLVATRNAA